MNIKISLLIHADNLTDGHAIIVGYNLFAFLFPYFREMLRMESVCRTVGFDDEQTATLIKGKPLEYSGELYSEEHKRKFTVERVMAQITSDPTDKRKLQLNIDKIPFNEWCRVKFEKLRDTFCQPVQRQQKYKGLKF